MLGVEFVTLLASPHTSSAIHFRPVLFFYAAEIRQRAVRAVDEDVEGERDLGSMTAKYLTINQLLDRSSRHKADKRGFKLQLFNATKKSMRLSKKIEAHKRMAVMLSSEDIPGLKRIFAAALRKGASIHYLLDHLSRAVNGDYVARGYDKRSIELATVVMRLGGPALLKVLHKAGDLPGVSLVQSRLQKSTVRCGTRANRIG